MAPKSCTYCRRLTIYFGLISFVFAADHPKVEESLGTVFDEDETIIEKSLAEVRAVLVEGNFSDVDILKQTVGIAQKGFSIWQNFNGVQQTIDLLQDNKDLVAVLHENKDSGAALAEKGLKAIKRYAAKADKNQKLGKFAKISQISKMAKVHQKDIQEAISEAASQKKVLGEQLQRQSKIAGVLALTQLVESGIKCYSTVSAYYENSGKLDKWRKMIEDWTKQLNMNRKAMLKVLDKYSQTKEWDLTGLAMISWTSTEILGEVKKFNNDLVAKQKAAKAQWLDGSFGLLSHIVNFGLSMLHAMASPVSAVSWLGSGGAHGAAAAMDLASVIYAHLDLQQLHEILLRGEALLKESVHQVEVLKKGRAVIAMDLLNGPVKQAESRVENEQHLEL